MATSTSKKVVVLRFDREPLYGFVSPQAWLLAEGIELLSQSGSIQVVPYNDVKCVCFVREFTNTPSWQKRVFSTRPKTQGLWVRLDFKDGDYMDGVLPNDLLHLEQAGYTVAPPEMTANAQRVFVPRAALSTFQVLGVIGTPLKTKVGRKSGKPAAEEQLEMFKEPS